MTADDVITRAAQEVRDEHFQILNKQSLLKELDRLFRTYCKKTKILTDKIGLKMTGASEYQLSGITDLNNRFGDNLFEFYRVEYNGQRAFEMDFEDLMNLRVDKACNSNTVPVRFAVKYYRQTKRLYLPFQAPEGDKMVFYYYQIPRIGTINSLDYQLPIDDQNVDDLASPGLVHKCHEILMAHHLKEKNADLVKFHGQERYETRAQWYAMLEEVAGEKSNFVDESVPIAAAIPTLVHGSDDSFTEADSGY